jgi:hypothetical protein
MAHPYAEKAKGGHSKKLESYGGKSKKNDNWAGDKDLNTDEQRGIPIINKEPKLSEDTMPAIMRKAGGKIAPKRMDKAPRKGRATGGKMAAEKFEGTYKDETQDKKLAKKHGMSMKKWESSSLDKKHDEQQSMKGLKKGGRTERKDGGRIGKDMGGMLSGKKAPTTINIQMPGSGQPPMMAGQPLSGTPTAPAGAGPQLPPGMAGGPPPIGGGMPPMGAGAPPMMPMGQPGLTPPAAPMPPTGVPPMPPMGGPMGGFGQPNPLMRKKGGRVRSTEDLTAGAASGEGRLEKTELAEYDRKKG